CAALIARSCTYSLAFGRDKWGTPRRALSDNPGNLRRPYLEQRSVGTRLDIEPQQRFRVRGPQVEAPVAEIHAQPVDRLHLRIAAGEVIRDPLLHGPGVGDGEVDLARTGKGRDACLDAFGEAGARG